MNYQRDRYAGIPKRMSPHTNIGEDVDEEKAKDSNSHEFSSAKTVNRSDSQRQSGANNDLCLWVSQPVIGFVCEPHFTCTFENGEELQDPTSKYRFTWYRSRKYYLCNSESCINLASRSNSSIELKCQCLTCLQYGNERNSYFCCPECMRRGWKAHCLTHHISPSSTVRVEKKLPIDSSMTVDELADLQVKQARNQKTAIEGWEKVSTDIIYKPTEIDMGHILKVVVTSLDSDEVLKSIDTKPVINPPSYVHPREWIKRASGTTFPQASPLLTITSYNMLADIYCRSELYSLCPYWALDWEYRRDRLKKQIDVRDSDIFCLQEVEKGQYEHFWKVEMKKRGYQSHFTIKTRLVQGSDEHIDGCATFFKENVLVNGGFVDISFNQLAENLYASDVITQKQLNRLKRGNVAHVLQMKYFITMPPFLFYVCNCHLFWDPKFSDVKLIQAWYLLNQLQMLMQYQPIPVIICGDFNSEPTSAVYEFISTGHVSPNNPDVQDDPEGIIKAIGLQNIHHELALKSCYKEVMNEEPKYTNFTDHYQGCLDYIWVTNTSLQPMQVSALPTVEEICSFGDLKLPNPKYPSDHLALDCTMMIDARQTQRF